MKREKDIKAMGTKIFKKYSKALEYAHESCGVVFMIDSNNLRKDFLVVPHSTNCGVRVGTVDFDHSSSDFQCYKNSTDFVGIHKN